MAPFFPRELVVVLVMATQVAIGTRTLLVPPAPSTSACGIINSTIYPGRIINFTSLILPPGQGHHFVASYPWTLSVCQPGPCKGQACKGKQDWLPKAKYEELNNTIGFRMSGNGYWGFMVMDFICDLKVNATEVYYVNSWGYESKYGFHFTLTSKAACIYEP